MGAGIAVLGFALGGLLTEQSVLDFPILGVAQPTSSLADAGLLPALLNMSTAWLIVAAITCIGFLLWLLPKPSPAAGSWAWHKTGLALAALGILAWLAGSPSGWHWGLSMTGPSRSLLTAVLDQSWHPMTWGAFMLLGVPLGSLLSAWLKGTTRWEVPAPREFRRRFLGGLLMGFGGTLAGGCNIGNALTGLSILSVNSFLATASIVLGLAIAVRVESARSWLS